MPAKAILRVLGAHWLVLCLGMVVALAWFLLLAETMKRVFFRVLARTPERLG